MALYLNHRAPVDFGFASMDATRSVSAAITLRSSRRTIRSAQRRCRTSRRASPDITASASRSCYAAWTCANPNLRRVAELSVEFHSRARLSLRRDVPDRAVPPGRMARHGYFDNSPTSFVLCQVQLNEG